MVPPTSLRAASVPSAVSMLLTSLLGYLAISRCLSTMKSDFVEVGSELGSVPAAKLDGEPLGKVRAGQFAGSGGGGGSRTRRPTGRVLGGPLYPPPPAAA